MFQAVDEAGLTEPARAFVRAVAGLSAQDVTLLPGAQALYETAVLLAAREKLQAVTLSRIADVDRRQLYTLEGAASTSSWVAEQHTSTDRGIVALARKLARMPGVEAAVLDGRLGMPAAEKVGVALDQTRRHVDRPDGRIDGFDGDAVVHNVVVNGVLGVLSEARGGYADDDPALHDLVGQLQQIACAPLSQQARLEHGFVLLAERLEPGLLNGGLERLVGAVLPLQLEDKADAAHRERNLKLTLNSDGSGWTIAAGKLDLECGELLQTVLTAAAATDPDNPADTAAWANRRDADEQADGRADAAQDMAARELAARQQAQQAADNGEDTQDGEGWALFGPGGTGEAGEAPVLDPRTRGQQAHDALKLALRRLLDSAALGTRGKTAPHILVTVSADTLDGQPGALPAVAGSGAVLPAGLVRRLGCDSRLTRLVMSLGRKVIETSHTQRTLKAHERLALHVQWGGRCAGAGCPCPPGTPVVPHHATPHARCGTTSYQDSVWVCGSHHHDVHEGKKVIKLRDGRYLGPDGWADGPSR